MQINTYNNFYESYFKNPVFLDDFGKALKMLDGIRNVFFIGNGGSNAVCCHMMEDFAKIAGFRTFGFSDPALITCFSNDYGYENAMAEWLKIYFEKGDLLVSISSSGNSKNILNATKCANELGGKIITLTGFKPGNLLSSMGNVNFHLPIENYGVVECFHQVILHAVLDEYAQKLKGK
ncbi:MAG: phosphoheptose isomerase [Bacteroidetes bacterium]|jgi:D-sedoheptulose 7-phosphate isomerase|nr:phosphoheptose isomerase [Bacteroidota bacterium]